MVEDYHIGDWVQRRYDATNYASTKWHLIESQIEDRVVTKCGRQLRDYTDAKVSNHLSFSPVEPFTRSMEQPQLCKRCR